MSDRSIDRHKGKRSYKSGFEKAKEKKEVEQKNEALLSKTHKLTDFFFTKNSPTTIANEHSEQSDNILQKKDDLDDTDNEKNETHTNDKSNAFPNNENNTTNELSNASSDKQEIKYDKDMSELFDNSTVNADYWISQGSSSLQNSSLEVIDSKSFIQQDGNKLRKCNISMFERIVKNGECIKRSWLCFSPITGKLYCFHCKLFTSAQSQFTQEGFCDWKNAHTRLQEHEKSQTHLKAVYNFTIRASARGLINDNIRKEMEDEINYWRKILRRVIDVIIFLAERNLPFRGENEIIGMPNNGNFLGAIELLATQDDFLKAHILKYAQCGKGHVNYLSSTIYEELIEIINNRLLTTIIENIKKSK